MDKSIVASRTDLPIIGTGLSRNRTESQLTSSHTRRYACPGAGYSVKTKLAHIMLSQLPSTEPYSLHQESYFTPEATMDALVYDLRHGLRSLAKHPSFTVIAIAILALGIGANSAIFSIVNGVLLRPLDFDSPDRLLMIWGQNQRTGVQSDPVSYPNFLDWRERNRSFEEMAAVTPLWRFNMTGAGNPERITGIFATPNLMRTLGTGPIMGRDFTEADAQAGSEPTIILSHSFWQRKFSGSPAMIGNTVVLDGIAFTVIAILPPGISVLENVDIWTPITADNPAMARFIERRSVRLFRAIGRLRMGVDEEQAQVDMSRLAAQLEQEYPTTNTDLDIRLMPFMDQITGPIRPALLILFGAVGFVLLIACANVANLILSKTAARRKEVAVRVALGASRGRLIRQLLTESLLLSLFGGAAGIMLSVWGVDAVIALSPEALPRTGSIELDGRVIGFTLIVTLLTVVFFGLIPAIQASRVDQNETLKESGRSVSSGASRLRDGIVVFEIAAAFVLLVGCGLLVRSFGQVLDEKPGYTTENLLTFYTLLPGSVYSSAPTRARFWTELESRLRVLPGVTNVGATTRMPMRGPNNNVTSTLTRESVLLAEGEKPDVDFRRSSPRYFETMDIPLVAGRFFDERDVELQTAIVTEATVQRHFSGGTGLGQRIKLGSNSDDAKWITIVGVVADIRHTALDIEPRPEVYRPLLSSPPLGAHWAVRTSVAPMTLLNPIRAIMLDMDPDLPLSEVATMDELLEGSLGSRRFSLLLVGGFAWIALVLATMGIYGVMSYHVSQQTREIGVRMALGARPAAINRLIVYKGMKLAGLGAIIGLLSALALADVLDHLLYGITSYDAMTYVAILAILGAVCLMANLLPARRAMGLDPMVALRGDG